MEIVVGDSRMKNVAGREGSPAFLLFLFVGSVLFQEQSYVFLVSKIVFRLADFAPFFFLPAGRRAICNYRSVVEET